MVPLSLEVFLGTLEHFNRMIRLMQMLASAFGLVALWVALRPQQLSSRMLGLILASSWAAAGLFYHLNTFAELNFWDYPAGLAFLIQALIVFWAGAGANRFTATVAVGANRHIGLALGFYALAGSPLVGIAAGRSWAEVGYFAISPGPTIVFTAAVLLMLGGPGLRLGLGTDGARSGSGHCLGRLVAADRRCRSPAHRVGGPASAVQTRHWNQSSMKNLAAARVAYSAVTKSFKKGANLRRLLSSGDIVPVSRSYRHAFLQAVEAQGQGFGSRAVRTLRFRS